MIGELPVDAALAALATVNFLIGWGLARAVRRRGLESDGPSPDSGRSRPPKTDGTTTGDSRDRAGAARDGRVVECPSCGTDNEREYRFCRRCVEELPGPDACVPRTGPTRRGSLL